MQVSFKTESLSLFVIGGLFITNEMLFGNLYITRLKELRSALLASDSADLIELNEYFKVENESHERTIKEKSAQFELCF